MFHDIRPETQVLLSRTRNDLIRPKTMLAPLPSIGTKIVAVFRFSQHDGGLLGGRARQLDDRMSAMTVPGVWSDIDCHLVSAPGRRLWRRM